MVSPSDIDCDLQDVPSNLIRHNYRGLNNKGEISNEVNECVCYGQKI